MKRIVVVSTSFLPIVGGQELGLLNLLEGVACSTAEYSFYILTPRYNRNHLKTERIRRIRILRYNSCLIRYPSWLLPTVVNTMLHVIYGFLFIRPYLRRINPDFVIVYFLVPSAPPAIYHIKSLGLRHLLFLGGSDVRLKTWPISSFNRWALLESPSIITTSEELKNVVVDQHRVPPTRFSKIPYSIRLDKYPILEKSWGHRVRLLTVHRLVKSKGTRTLIEAIHLLKIRGIEAYADIVGDGPERADLEQLTTSLGVQQQIVFRGELENSVVKQFYGRSQIFVLPSVDEGFGIVLLEAMASGNIIVAARSGAIPEILADGLTGLLVTPLDSLDLANTLERVLRDMPAHSQLARNARDEVRKYDQALIGNRLRQVLRKCMS